MKKISACIWDGTGNPSVIQLSKVYKKLVTLQPSHSASLGFNSYYI